jgi:spore coat protein U domain-containing protein, fimbrial subunit CupE1/2/3/6
MKRPRSHARTAARRAALAAAVVGAVLCARDAAAVQPTCSVSVASAIAFGAYDPFSTVPLDTTGTITLQHCSQTPVTIAIGPGRSGSFSSRAMRGPGGDLLRYDLYLDAARSIVWGDGAPGTSTWASASPSDRTIAVYARAFAAQDVSTGAYDDTITVTINY